MALILPMVLYDRMAHLPIYAINGSWLFKNSPRENTQPRKSNPINTGENNLMGTAPKPLLPDTIIAFLFSIPIGTLGGLIGLGGAEFRLPVLVGVLQKRVKSALPLNLAISLVTVVSSLLFRNRSIPLEGITRYLPVILAMISGAIPAAYLSAAITQKISTTQLRKTIFVILLMIGLLLMVESFLHPNGVRLLPSILLIELISGVLFGVLIGVFSSTLGVAGGELIIPTLIFMYGIDAKIAGSASLLISLPTILSGITRYSSIGNYRELNEFPQTILPMSVGSIIGASIGGWFVGFVSTSLIKLILGCILIYSAWHVFHK